MQWQHEVSKDWMLARKNYLTATDVVKLAPSAKKWKPGGSIPPAFYALWMEKHSEYEPDVVSYGAAARGHLLEPFAVLDANKVYRKNFSHWDDVIIHNGYLGFSPDAMDIPQPLLPVDIRYDDERIAGVREIMEVKCFAPYHHGQCVTCGVEKEQLFQVGVAFEVMPQLERATVLYYCPGALIDIEAYPVNRDAVNDADIGDVIKRVLRIWEELDQYMSEMIFDKPQASWTEEEIYKIVMKEVM